MDDVWEEFSPQAPAEVAAAPGIDPSAPMAAATSTPVDQWAEFNPVAAATPQFNKEAFAGKFTGPLAEKADVIEQKANQYGVPPALASAIIAQETGWGKSIGGNNVAGMMRGSQKMQFGSLDEGIDKAVSNIAKQYERSGRSLEGLRDIYAPIGAKNDPNGLNNDWLPGVKKIMGGLQ